MVDWKKDISFGRTPKSDGDPELAQPGTEPEKVSFWKKEIGGSKKAKEGDEQRAASKDEAKTPFWKKEVSLGRKKAEAGERSVSEGEDPDAAEQMLRSALDVVAAQQAAAAVVVQPAGDAPAPEADVAAAEPPPDPEPVLPPAAEVAAAGATVDEREQLHPVSWVDAVLHASVAEDGATQGLALPPVEEPVLPPAAETPLPLPEAPPTEAVALEPPPAAVAPPPVVPAVPLPPPPEPIPVAAAAVVHPPVPEAELAPVEDEAKVPFWKKEIGGSKKSKKEKAPKQAKAPKEPKADSGEKVPFWKKEIGGSKKAAVVATTAAVASEPAAAKSKTPFWKLEVGGSKKKKNKKSKETDAAAPAEDAGAKKPLKKKRGGFSMPRLELPSRPQKSGGTQRHKELVGLKIGASQIAAARVTNNGVAEVLQVAREGIEPNIVVGGELRDPEALSEALKDFFRENKLPKKGIRLGIANNRIGVRTFEITGIEDPKQLSNAIRFRAQEALPIPIEDAVLDYHILSETTNAEGETVRKVLLVVVYRELVDRYVAACRDAGLTLVGIDLEAFALLRSLAAPREEEGPAPAALVAVAVGHDRSTFAVSDGRVCEFTRVLDWGGWTLSVAIANKLQKTPTEIEPLKLALSLEPGAVPEGISPEVAAAAQEAAKAEINKFARELVSSLQFYQNQQGSLGIGEIIVTGGTAEMPGFAAELQRLIGVRVKVGDPLVRVKVGKRVEEPERLGSLAIAIGLGIED